MNCIPINKNVDFGKKNQNIIHILKKCHVNCIPINKNVDLELASKKHFCFYDIEIFKNATQWTVKFCKNVTTRRQNCQEIYWDCCKKLQKFCTFEQFFKIKLQSYIMLGAERHGCGICKRVGLLVVFILCLLAFW